MIVVSVPDEQTRQQLLPAPEGIRIVVWDLYSAPSEGTIDDIAVVLIPHYQLDRAPFAQFATMQNLQMIQLPSSGYEHIVSWLPDGVTLCNGRGIHSEETAELAVGLMLASLRGIAEHAVNAVTDRGWNMRMRRSLFRSRVLIVGYGSVGQEIAHRLQAFGAEVEAVARSPRVVVGVRVHAMDDLPDLLPTADIVTLILPLSASTRSLVDSEFLARMADGALLVNVARGPIVDTSALLAELMSGRLRAALDVTDPEPLPSDHPLWRAPNVIITPHEGGNTTASAFKTIELMAAQIQRLAAGTELENVVVPGRLAAS